MLKLRLWKREEKEVPEQSKEDKIILDQKSLNIGSSIGELNQKFDRLSTTVGQCFLVLDDKIDSYKDNIIVIQDGIGKQVEQHEEMKDKIDSYENKVLRLIRNLRFEIEAEINATKDEGTKERLSGTVEKINTSLIVNLLRELGPVETRVLEEEVIKRNICSKATLFRKLKTLRERELVFKQEKDGISFYSVSPFDESKEDSLDNLDNLTSEQTQSNSETPKENT